MESAVQYVLDEVYNDFELLICDDASTDRSLEIVRKFEKIDPRVKVWTREKNVGKVSINYQFLAEKAQGDYIMTSDADDVAFPNRMISLIKVAEQHPDAVMIYGNVVLTNSDLTKMLGRYSSPFSAYQLFKGNYIPDGAVLIKRESFFEAGGYNTSITWAEDYELRLRLALLGPFIHLKQDLYAYRQHNESWTANRFDISEEHKFKANIIKKYESTPPESHQMEKVLNLYRLAQLSESKPESWINRVIEKMRSSVMNSNLDFNEIASDLVFFAGDIGSAFNLKVAREYFEITKKNQSVVFYRFHPNMFPKSRTTYHIQSPLYNELTDENPFPFWTQISHPVHRFYLSGNNPNFQDAPFPMETLFTEYSLFQCLYDQNASIIFSPESDSAMSLLAAFARSKFNLEPAPGFEIPVVRKDGRLSLVWAPELTDELHEKLRQIWRILPDSRQFVWKRKSFEIVPMKAWVSVAAAIIEDCKTI